MALRDAPQCEAKAKRTGERCKNPAVAGRAKCRLHGGKSPAGVRSATFKTGRYSRSLPARLAERYAEAQADEKLTEMRDEIALIDARLAELLGRIDTGESGTLWIRVVKAFHDYDEHRGGIHDRDKYTALSAAIEDGLADHANWLEIREAIEQRRRLAESEHKRLKDLQQMMTTEQAMTLLGGVVATIRDHVKDADLLRAIHTDLSGLLRGGPAARA